MTSAEGHGTNVKNAPFQCPMLHDTYWICDMEWPSKVVATLITKSWKLCRHKLAENWLVGASPFNKWQWIIKVRLHLCKERRHEWLMVQNSAHMANMGFSLYKRRVKLSILNVLKTVCFGCFNDFFGKRVREDKRYPLQIDDTEVDDYY